MPDMNALYKLYLQQTNRQTPATSQDATGGMDANSLVDYLKRLKSIYNLYAKVSGSPSTGEYISKGWDAAKNWFNPSETMSGAGAGAEGAPIAGEAAVGAGADAGSGLSGLSAGGYATVAAPLVMAYLKYQAGSGINEPLWKKAQTMGGGKMLSDIIAGTKVAPEDTYSKYGLEAKELPAWMQGEGYIRGQGTVDPRGYTPFDLYDMMHSYSTGKRQVGGLGNSGYSDPQIDEMFGSNKDAVAKQLGVDSLPDWAGYNDTQGFDPNMKTPWSVGSPGAINAKRDAEWNALHSQEDPISRDPQARSAWDAEQQIAELEKFLGYKIRSDENKNNQSMW